MRKAAEHVKNSWNALTPGKQALAGIIGLETLSVLYNGCGVVENVLGTILGPLLKQLEALIFRSKSSGSTKKTQNIYRNQYRIERIAENQQGLILGLIGKIAFYLRGSCVDFIRAFYRGCKGDPLGQDDIDGPDKNVGLLEHDGIFDFYNYKKVENWGPNQLGLFLESMKMDWKHSPLNVWVYRFGRLFASGGAKSEFTLDDDGMILVNKSANPRISMDNDAND